MSISSIRMCLTISTLAASAALGACSHNDRPAAHAARTQHMAYGSQNAKSAVNDIVNARCDLEQRCSNIASGKKYDSRDMCESKLQGATADDLNTKDCPHGVDQGKLSTCLSDIKAESCGNPFDSLSRWNACRTGQICLQG
jgi:Family of unknown function (DUF6184)